MRRRGLYPKLYPLSVGIRVIQYEDWVAIDQRFEPGFTTSSSMVRRHGKSARQVGRRSGLIPSARRFHSSRFFFTNPAGSGGRDAIISHLAGSKCRQNTDEVELANLA